MVLEYEQAGVAGDEKSEEKGDGADGDKKPAAAPSVNELLVEAGLARVPRDAASAARRVVGGGEMLARLEEAQLRAKAAHVGMWRYGDIGDEDEDEPVGNPRPPR